MKYFGLIGKPLGHSFSPAFFTAFFAKNRIDAQYKLVEVPNIDSIPIVLRENFHGLNVTIPYKEAIIPFLDELSPEARTVGAVNTVVFKEGKTTGHNTDTFGFQQAIKPFLTFEHERALILGTGGSSKAVSFVLKNLGIQVSFLSREQQVPHIYGYDQVNETMLKAFKLLVNCTPVGMFPKMDACPLPLLDGIGPRHLVVDLIYNPEETLLLMQAKLRGAAILNGLPMLHAQALKSWELWHHLD